ncbi:MAG: ion transporter [Methylococcaceae bacterium]
MDNLDNLRDKIHGRDYRAKISTNLPTRQWLHSWLFDTEIEGNYQKDVENWIGALIVLNLIVLLFEHVHKIYDPNQHLFHLFDIFSVVVFTFEYLLRLYLSPEDSEFTKNEKHNAYVNYIKSPFAIVDFFAVAPFYIQAFLPIDLRILRFLRLLRILKLFRVLIPSYKEFVSLNQGRTFRQKIHAIIFPSEFGGSLQGIFDSFIVVWVIISVLCVILESVSQIRYILNIQFIIIDAFAVSIFTIEYCLRLYCCVENPQFSHPITGRFKQAQTTSSIIDFFAILPFFLEVFLHHLLDLRFLRVFRLMRLLKLTRYTGATSTLTKVIAREFPVMCTAAFIMLLLVIMTASLGYLFEHEAQPDKFENIPQSIYWAVITLASVGYGDIYPITPLGRVMTILMSLLGIGIFAIPAALLSSAFTDQLRIERETLKNSLYEILSDGIIDEQETAFIAKEAQRLHLNEDEVARLIDRASKDRELQDDVSKLPLHKIAQHPETAIKHYRLLLSQIKMLSIMTNNEKFIETAVKQDRLTKKDLEFWNKMHAHEINIKS